MKPSEEARLHARRHFLSEHGICAFYAVCVLVILLAFAIDGHPRLEIGRSLLKAFRTPWHNVLPAENQYWYGSPLVIWLGFAFQIETDRGLWLFAVGMLTFSLLGVLSLIGTSSLTASARLRFFFAFFAGSTLSVFLEWLGKSDCLLLFGYLVVFFRGGHPLWAVLGVVVMAFAHIEQALVLLGFHVLLRWDRAEGRRPAQIALLAGTLAALTYRAVQHGIGMSTDSTRAAWAKETGLHQLRQLSLGQGEAWLSLLVAWLSVLGAGWLFFGLWFARAKQAERLRLLLVPILAWFIACTTHDIVRVATILGWPLLAHAAERWARSEEPLFGFLSPSVARIAMVAFCVLWWIKAA